MGNPVDASIDPTGWVRLHVVVGSSKVQIYVGSANEVTLEVRKLGLLDGGQVGLWVGNVSGGDFANLVITPTNLLRRSIFWDAEVAWRQTVLRAAVLTGGRQPSDRKGDVRRV